MLWMKQTYALDEANLRFGWSKAQAKSEKQIKMIKKTADFITINRFFL